MAHGTIKKNPPPDGTPGTGTIIISEGGSVTTRGGGDGTPTETPVDPVPGGDPTTRTTTTATAGTATTGDTTRGGTIASVAPGEVIDFSNGNGATEGDLVSFNAVQEPSGELVAEDIAVTATGTLITGDVNEEIEIGENQVVTISNATVGDEVEAEKANTVVIENSTINGDVEVEETANVVIVNNTINGELDLEDNTNETVSGNTINDND